jgi:beta-glucosidase
VLLGVTLSVLISACHSGKVTTTAAPRPSPTSDQRADQLISQMTLDEKVQLVHGVLTPATHLWNFVPGIPRLGIPDLSEADGSDGLGNGIGPATALPSSIASAASWDSVEAYQYGTVIGKELRAYAKNVNLGGSVNLTAREPRDGRTYETKGEDPILAGNITAAHLRAVQNQHVVACIKPFAFNDQETGRGTVDAVIDERSARESDLLAFEIGLKESNAQSVMCAFNQVNGVYSCGSEHLLNTVLKHDWGFAGFVLSDFDAAPSSFPAALAGLDQDVPDGMMFGGVNAEGLKQAVMNGDLPLSRLDDMVHRILRALFVAGVFDNPAVASPIDAVGDALIAQEMEEQGVVLLKNSLAVLPLDATKLRSIAVIGSHADIAVLSGGGSAQVIPVGGPALTFPAVPPGNGQQIWDPDSPLAAIRAKSPNAIVQFNDGNDPSAAAAFAMSADVAIVFVNQWETENIDLPNLNLPNQQDALVTAVATVNPHTIVVVESGGALLMPWLTRTAAVLEAWYPGQRGAEAIANILFGDVNPSGKLPITFPASVADLPRPVIPVPPDSTSPFVINYTEGLLVGYKWYDARGFSPLFPFGYGLSYTTFNITNAKLSSGTILAAGFQVDFDLQNIGARAGAEVPQVYLALPANLNESPVRLVGWQKVLLQPQQSQHVTIKVDANASSHPLSYWDVMSSSWQVAVGDYTVYLGNSSRARSSAGTFTIAR